MAGVIFEILVVAALAVPADSLKLEDWLKPGTEVRSVGVRASTVLYVRDPWLLGVGVVSAGIGCWVSVRWKAHEH